MRTEHAQPNITDQAKALALRTEDAYSFDRYANWPATAQALLDFGLNEAQAEAVLRSKFMRWAADQVDFPYGEVPAQAIIEALEKPHNLLIGRNQDLMTEINKMVEQA
jgi:hypothetical protein